MSPRAWRSALLFSLLLWALIAAVVYLAVGRG